MALHFSDDRSAFSLIFKQYAASKGPDLPITLAHQSPTVLAVHPQFPAKSVPDLIAIAKAKPGELDFGSAGTGSSTHLAAQLFGRMHKLQDGRNLSRRSKMMLCGKICHAA